MRLNDQRVARGFWPKIRKAADQLPVAADALALVVLRARRGHALLRQPTDAIPDVIPLIGCTADAAVLAALVGLAGRCVTPRHREAARQAIVRLREFD